MKVTSSKHLMKLPPLVAAVASIVAGVLGFAHGLGAPWGIEIPPVDGFLLGILGFLAVDAVLERTAVVESVRTMVIDLVRQFKQLRWQVSSRGHLLLYREQLPSLRDRVLPEGAAVHELCVCDYTLAGLLRLNQRLLEELLDGGTCIRLILVEPESPLSSTLVDDWFSDFTEGREEEASSSIIIRFSYAVLARLRRHAEAATGTLEVRTLTGVPFQGLMLIDPHKDSGELQLQEHLHSSDSAQLPVMVLRKNEEPKLFDRYWDEWRWFWNHGQTAQLPPGQGDAANVVEFNEA